MYNQCPVLHQNKPSRELIFCERVGSWWIKRAVFVLKFLLKKWTTFGLTSWLQLA